MGCLAIGCFGALLGRIAVLTLWIIGWFGHARIGFIWLVVGFLFAPLTVICVGCVNNFFQGHWGFWQIVALVFCLMSDLGGNGSSAAKSRKRR
ncbi:MAG: hypothetical protein WCX65_06485 [bacterium]